MRDVKKWSVKYAHDDGRAGMIEVETEIVNSNAFRYGNGKGGILRISDSETYLYDLRYSSGNLHRVMLEQYFGNGIIKVTEL